MGRRELIEAGVEAFNTRGVDRIVGFYSEDATNHQLPEAPVTGRDAIRAMFKRELAPAEMVLFPKTSLRMGNGAFSNGAIRLVCGDAGFFHIVNGQIVLQRGYWDKLTFLKIHGLPLPTD
jgi:ketosteroid isomerase-like protein